MSGNVKTLSDGYAQMQSGYQQMGESYQGAANALLGVKTALTQMQSMITALGSSYANANSDPNYLGIKQTVNQLLSSLSQITPDGIQTLNENYNATTSGFDTANQGLSQIAAGLSQMADGLTKLKSGIDRSADGIGTIITNMNSVSTGLGQMKSGQQILANGLNGLSTFSGNLSDVNSGLQQISDGLSKTNGFLNELNANKTFFIPNEALTSPDFVKSLDNFMSKDRTITKMIVILNDDPYSAAALNTVKNINTTVSGVLKSSSLNNVQCGVSGPTANTYDLNNILSRDLNRMIIIVLLGILIILILVMRSFWKPVFITLSLVGAYYAASFVTNVIFIDLMHYSGLSSFVPFFAFIIICALGVDYSIFLMMRFKEYPELAPKEAIVTASRHIGGVVTAAVIILGGTFATLIPSGMRILFELAIYVIIGLIVLCFVMLPIFIPAMITLIESVSKISHKQK
jgi:RND superfamily putative drug exporter